MSIALKRPEDGPDADFARQYSGFVVFCGSVNGADGSAEGSKNFRRRRFAKP